MCGWFSVHFCSPPCCHVLGDSGIHLEVPLHHLDRNFLVLLYQRHCHLYPTPATLHLSFPFCALYLYSPSPPWMILWTPLVTTPAPHHLLVGMFVSLTQPPDPQPKLSGCPSATYWSKYASKSVPPSPLCWHPMSPSPKPKSGVCPSSSCFFSAQIQPTPGPLPFSTILHCSLRGPPKHISEAPHQGGLTPLL